ncbi:LysM domain-containing protein [Frankia sp. EI5c]|nr:LysM domain-containing protein [Frankia sp. EI5c]
MAHCDGVTGGGGSVGAGTRAPAAVPGRRVALVGAVAPGGRRASGRRGAGVGGVAVRSRAVRGRVVRGQVVRGRSVPAVDRRRIGRPGTAHCRGGGQVAFPAVGAGGSEVPAAGAGSAQIIVMPGIQWRVLAVSGALAPHRTNPHRPEQHRPEPPAPHRLPPAPRRSVPAPRRSVPAQRLPETLRPRRERRQPPLRLTRRGRVVVMALTSAALAVVLSLALVTASQAFTGGQESYRTHLVRPGETLWEIALGANPDADTREVVRQLMSLNDLRTPALLPGQELRLP